MVRSRAIADLPRFVNYRARRLEPCGRPVLRDARQAMAAIGAHSVLARSSGRGGTSASARLPIHFERDNGLAVRNRAFLLSASDSRRDTDCPRRKSLLASAAARDRNAAALTT